MNNKKDCITLSVALILLVIGHAQLSSGKEYPSTQSQTVRSKHLDAGKVLFEDHFSQDGNLAEDRKWPVISGLWSVQNGVLTVTNNGGPATEAYILAGDSTWRDYSITGEVCPDKFSTVDNDAGILVRVNSDSSFGSRYTICLNGYKNWVGCANDRGPKQWIGHGKFRFAPNTWYAFNVTVHDSTLKVSINDRPILKCNHLLLTHGKIGLEAWNQGTQRFRNIRVTRIG